MSDSSELPKVLLAGIDSLYIGFYIDSLGLDWEDLAFRKEEVQHKRQEFAVVTLGARKWALLPRGRHPYTYVLKSPDLTVSLAERMQPRCFVQFHSEGLWTCGAESLIADLRHWFRTVGTTETRPESISRSDWSFDIALTRPDFLPEHVLTRAVKDATWRRSGSIQTMQFGKGEVVLRIYDKVAEIEEQSGKAWLHDLWSRKEGVWRTEFQVRRDRLKEFGITTMDDLRSFEGDLLTYLASQYASLRKPNSDSNKSRWPIHPMWQSLEGAIRGLSRHGIVRSYDPETPLAYAEEKSLKSVEGMLKNLASIRTIRTGRNSPVSQSELLKWLSSSLARRTPMELWNEDVREKVEKRRFRL